MHICFDWDGTLARKDVAEEASLRRGKTLGLSMDPEWIAHAMKTHAHYKVNKEAIAKYTGITDEQLLTTIMTDIFRFHYLAVVHEWKEKIFFEDIPDLLRELKKQGHTISIASTLRQDILDYSVKLMRMQAVIGLICANTPDLLYSKTDLVQKVVEGAGPVNIMVGDREEDMQAGKAVGSKTIFVTWGAEDEKKGIADTIVRTPVELLNALIPDAA